MCLLCDCSEEEYYDWELPFKTESQSASYSTNHSTPNVIQASCTPHILVQHSLLLMHV